MTFVIQQTLLYAVPLMIVALAGVFAERSGIINLALEGIMIFGAFIGVLFVRSVQGMDVFVNAFRSDLHSRNRLGAYIFRRMSALFRQTQHSAVLIFSAAQLMQQTVLFHFRHRSGYRSLVLVADLTQIRSGDPLGIALHGHQILGVSTLQTELFHFLTLNALNVSVDGGNIGYKLLKTIKQGNSSLSLYTISIVDTST